MSDYTDEFEFTEFTEDELRAIDSTAEAAFATGAGPPAWPVSSSSPQISTTIGESKSISRCRLMANQKSHPQAEEIEPLLLRSRKSSGFSTVELTEEELRQIDESVAHLGSTDTSQSSSALDSENTPSAPLTRSQPTYVEIAIESPVPSTLAASPAPTLGRTPTPSPIPSPSLGTMSSLYAQFRASRNSLSVSDLVGPIWCEVQFDYGLRGRRHLPPSQRPAVVQTRLGKEIKVQRNVAVENDKVMKGGTAVHKKLEQEIRPVEIEVTPNTREDIWGLKLFNMLSNIRILIDEGRCREMPVMGFVHGHFVTGIIDEIVRTPNPPVSPTLPGAFPQHLQYADSGASPPYTISILDNKTRGTSSKPRQRDTVQSQMQLMLYKRLLDALLIPDSGARPETLPKLSLSDIWTHHSLDPSVRFSPSFLEDSAVLVESNCLGPKAERATCLGDLEDAWNTIVDELVGIGQGHEAVSKMLKLVYRRRKAKSPKRNDLTTTGAGSSRTESRDSSSEGEGQTKRRNKKIRADSEDLELQRAIQASLESSRNQSTGLQDEVGEVIRGQTKGEQADMAQGCGDTVHAPGGWVSHDTDLQRAIEASKKSYLAETGKSAPLTPAFISDPKRKRESDEGIIGTVEFEYDAVTLESHLKDVLDFWHDRRLPRGVTIEDTHRCQYCEFSDGCEWLEDKAKAIMEGIHK